MGFVARIGQAASALNASQIVIPVSAATAGNGTLLVAVGFGVTNVITTVSSVADTQGNTYVLDARAQPNGLFRNAELWRCTWFRPLAVMDSSGTGDEIIVTLTGGESRGIAAIADQFTAMTLDTEANYVSNPLVNGYKLQGTVGATDVLSYAVIVPDFTVTWINPPSGYMLTGPPVMPASQTSLATAYDSTPTPGTVVSDWSWGPQAHSNAGILAQYSQAPLLSDAAAGGDAISVQLTQLVARSDAGACLDGFSVIQGLIV